MMNMITNEITFFTKEVQNVITGHWGCYNVTQNFFVEDEIFWEFKEIIKPSLLFYKKEKIYSVEGFIYINNYHCTWSIG